MRISVELTTEKDKHLPAYRYSMLTDVATCPTLGALNYGFMGRESSESTDETVARSTALEAGSACHQVFAAVRLWELAPKNSDLRLNETFLFNGHRVFGKDVLQQMVDAANKMHSAGEDERMQKHAFCLKALELFGYYDDPNDPKRTYANIEQVCAAYIDRWDSSRKLWVGEDGVAGIEIPFDVTIRAFEEETYAAYEANGFSSDAVREEEVFAARYIGTIDGLHYSLSNPDQVIVHENKTGKYLNQPWADTFLMSHQVTGYCVAASMLTGQQVREALILGSQIPIKSDAPVRLEVVQRNEHHIEQWMRWFIWCVDQFEKAKLDPINAPKFSHSCNRYFKICHFMPFCDGDVETKQAILNELKERGTNHVESVYN